MSTPFWKKTTDPEGHPVTYTLEIATDEAFADTVYRDEELRASTGAINIDTALLNGDKGLKDQTVYYWRVIAVDWYGAQTLSACQTAVGDERAALGLAGVAIKAGVGSALASLWFVSDAATSELMAAFYRQLQDPNLSKAKALQNVQVKFIKDRSRFYHPVYWAPFLLIGNWM